ncbi:hypothetical protein MTO96_039869 [Rhipicephalus appendiculatus]
MLLLPARNSLFLNVAENVVAMRPKCIHASLELVPKKLRVVVVVTAFGAVLEMALLPLWRRLVGEASRAHGDQQSLFLVLGGAVDYHLVGNP